MGIDPGVKGCAAILDTYYTSVLRGRDFQVFQFAKEGHWDEFLNVLQDYRHHASENTEVEFRIRLERVWARPTFGGDKGQNQSGQGKMMEQYGRVRGVLEALGFDYEAVTPQYWQKEIGLVHPPGCDYPCRKRIHVERASEIWKDRLIWNGSPKLRVTQENADALLILHSILPHVL